jgi:phosphate transport system substrate-binding protein
MNAGSASESPTPTVHRPVVRRRRGRAGIYAAIGAVVVAVVVIGVGLSTGWYGLQGTSKSSSGCSQGITLQGDGAQLVAPLMSVWTSTFASQTGNQVNYPASGSGTGLTHFTSTSIDFAVTDDPLTPAERTAMPGPPLTLPFVGGALTIIYNLPGVPGHLNLTGGLLADIYNGNVTLWNDPAIGAINPGVNLPAATIYTVHRADAAGATYVLTDFLSQSSTYWASHVGKGISISFPTAPKQTAEKGNALMISTVTANPDSIGYSDLTDVLTSASPPQYAAIQNPAEHYIVPTIANTVSAIVDKVQSLLKVPASAGDWFNVSMVKANGSSDYPIATFIYMFVYQQTEKGFSPTLAKSQVLVQWLHWTLTTGQGLANESQPAQLYYAPLPASILAVDNAGIQTMTFNGAAIPACT